MKNFREFYKGKKVLVTGNTGFKGSWLTMWLLNMGAEVYGISDKIPTDPSMFLALDLESKIHNFYEDIRNYEKVKTLIHEIAPDFVFHFAAQPIVSLSYINPLNTLSSNIMGTAHVLESLRTIKTPCISVIITSDKAYENVEQIWGYREIDRLGGKDIYSGSKGAAELVFHSYYYSFFKDSTSHVRIATARAGNVIGGGDWAADRIVVDCVRAWSTGEVVEIRSPKATRPWQHVLEPLSGYLVLGRVLSEDTRFNGESFNFGPKSEQNHTVLKLINDLSSYWKLDSNEVAFKVKDNIPFNEASLLKLNCDKALFHLNWMPTLSYDETIEFVSKWYYRFYIEKKEMYEFTMEQIKMYEKLGNYT